VLVTVVTPTFNAVRYLEACIHSVQAQAGPRVEVEHILADGGSTDGTVELARSLGVTVLEAPDEGLYDADNKGAAASSGELLGFLGADDLLLPGALDAVVRCYESERRPMIVGGVRWIDGDGRSLGKLRPPPPWMNARMLADLGWCYIHQMATYVSRDLYDELGRFEISLTVASDYDFFCKALEHAPWSRVNRELACFRRHGSNMSMTSPRAADDYRVIADRHAASSVLVRNLDKWALKLWANGRNPGWAIGKKVTAYRARRERAAAPRESRSG
jgi:glycosyltransferase involved in cell wall biosynthesis